MGVIQGGRLVFGGTEGPAGGSGTMWTTPVGQLNQNLVCFDTSEAAVSTIPASGTSLLTNLDRIRSGAAINPDFVPVNYVIAAPKDLNNHLESIDDFLSITEAAVEPSSTFAHQFWIDTS